MQEKVNALMIKSVDYGDNDKILTLFTLEKGVICAKIRGVKKAGAKLKFASEPFCFAEYILLNKNGMYSVINASLFDGFFPLRLDITKFYAGGVALEFVKKFCPENVTAEKIFIDLIKMLKILTYGESSPESVLLVFLISALAEIGYGITFSACSTCGGEISRPFFDFSSGAFYCDECRQESFIEIRVSTYKLLKEIAESGFSLFDEGYSFDEETCKRSLKFIAKYLKYNTSEELKNLNELLNL